MILGLLGGTRLAITLGNKLTARGVEVVYGVREEFKYKQIEWKIAQLQKKKVLGYQEAIEESDIVLICCENEYLSAVCACLSRPEAQGKLVIDCTNGEFDGNLKCNTNFIVEQSHHGRIIKAFNNLGLDYPHSDPLGLVKETYYCGDDSGDKLRVKRLIELIGFKAIDAGKLGNAALLEAVFHLRKEISYMGKSGREYHFGLMSV